VFWSGEWSPIGPARHSHLLDRSQPPPQPPWGWLDGSITTAAAVATAAGGGNESPRHRRLNQNNFVICENSTCIMPAVQQLGSVGPLTDLLLWVTIAERQSSL